MRPVVDFYPSTLGDGGGAAYATPASESLRGLRLRTQISYGELHRNHSARIIDWLGGLNDCFHISAIQFFLLD